MLHNVDAEWAVLGSVLYDNSTMDRLAQVVDETSFWEPVHSRLWRAARETIDRGEIADAITFSAMAETDAGLMALGGRSYLVELMSGAPSFGAALNYAVLVAELAERRRLVQAAERLARMAGDTMVSLADARSRFEDDMITEREGALTSMEGACADAVQGVVAAMGDGYPPGTVLTGLDPIDEAIGGFRPGHVTLIAAASSIGKSLLANRIALGAAGGAGGRQPVRVLYICPEMPAAENVIRLAAARMNEAYSRIERGDFAYDRQKDEFRAAMEALKRLPIVWRSGGGIRLDDLPRLVRSEQRRPGVPLGLVIVDPIAYLDAPGDGETERTTAVAVGLQDLASRTGLPVVPTHHLRKLDERKDHRPTEQDIRSSARLFDLANEVVLLHRDSYWAQKEPEPDDPDKLTKWRERCTALEMELLVAKRRGGGIGWRKVGCNVVTGRFWDLRYPNEHWEEVA